MADIQPRLLNVKQAARYLSIAPKTIRNRIGPRAPNPFPVKPKRIGKRVLFDRKDLDRFVDSLSSDLWIDNSVGYLLILFYKRFTNKWSTLGQLIGVQLSIEKNLHRINHSARMDFVHCKKRYKHTVIDGLSVKSEHIVNAEQQKYLKMSKKKS